MPTPTDAVLAIENAIRLLERKSQRKNEAQIRRAANRGDTKALRIVRTWAREDGRKAFPHYLPDGRRVSSLNQVAALMNTTRLVAAAYVREQKDVLPELRLEAKKLLPPPDNDADSVGIMLMMDPEDAIWLTGGSEVAMLHGPEDLHITLGYFGDMEEAPDKSYLTVICKALAQSFDPIEASIAGLTRFNGAEDSPNDAIVLNVDAAKIEDIRVALLNSDYDKTMVRNHGYTPHITIGYLPKTEELDFTRWPTTAKPDEHKKEIRINRITLMYGRDHIDYPLGVDKDPEQKDVFHGEGSIPWREERIRKILERAKRIKEKEEEEDD